MRGVSRNKVLKWYESDLDQRLLKNTNKIIIRQNMDRIAQDEENLDDPEVIAQTKALFSRAMAVIEVEFSQSHWQAFCSYFFEGKPSPVVAEELGLNEATIRGIKCRVINRLRTSLGYLLE